ncbi:carbohydrate ABC transporter permease [Deinococcus radiopugnans]|uniref:Lactose/L-arabinose transport system permease protein n=1 Tax=Deinococcus radiopugnans ATCC 19172 TaxID=585398 RepID=A0A5C4Y554_9DEIO|nr:sugar ABC transporter permease [Deinococcus radiopugnans]MBB6017373.1 lactose/L-arabinose transport system permease protein [Deinococcus radiopugnans ATCC 19172]QLG09619.1 sugar ABC transporter permease [Deinococcus sp. D7000]TNM70117.1 sugar ABC transporter permease [Deinococcus radiopugnans ATCC 19172]
MTTSQPLSPPARRAGRWARIPKAPYLFILPYLLIFATFWAWPIISSFLMSFKDSRLGADAPYALSNWSRLIQDEFFRTALRNTLVILVVQVPLMLSLATVLAVALNSKLLKAAGWFRFAFFAPLVVGTVAYSAVFRLLFNTDFGVVNRALTGIGLPAVDWLNQAGPAMSVIIMAMLWRWTGYNAIILLAGLQGISEDVYEAASIDGATPAQQFWKITLPLLRPTLLFCMVLSVIGTLQLFTEPALITNSGPGNATMTLGTYLYQQGFRSFNFGYASAIAYTVAAIAAVFSVIQLRLFGRER